MPRSDNATMLSPPAEHENHHTTCPPDDADASNSRENSLDRPNGTELVHSEPSPIASSASFRPASPLQQPTPPADGETPAYPDHRRESHSKHMDAEVDSLLRDVPTPTSSVEESPETEQRTGASPVPSTQSPTTIPYQPWRINSPFPHNRFLPNSTSSFLRPGSKFHGTQQSDLQVYDVNVELKYVDMNDSFLCGYLRIQGLTDDHPTLTTYFEGEIIGTKHTFITKHPEWGSNEKVDMQHWARFPSWRPLAKAAKRPDFSFKNFASRENIFMRWKEYFLVPDHRVRSLNGASYEGFYYICFNQVVGSVSGIYFHAKSEKYQQLELKHVPDHGCTGSIEFR